MAEHTFNENVELNIGELFITLWHHKFLIGLITSLSIFFAAHHALTVEKKYTARVIFQLKQENNQRFSMDSDFGALASFTGIGSNSINEAGILLERFMGREFILDSKSQLKLSDDPLFNSYNPNASDPLWKAIIKKIIGWRSTQSELDALIEDKIIKNYRTLVKPDTTDGGAFSISVTHTNPKTAAKYANGLMDQIRELIGVENENLKVQRLSYLSETLADALNEMEVAQQNLKEYALQNSTAAQANFISESLRIDNLRMQKRDAIKISEVVGFLNTFVKINELNESAYESLRNSYPLVDDVSFRRILGMSETISAWSWPDLGTLRAVTATLNDRIKSLEIEILDLEENAKLYASSAENLARFTREAKIAEATYTVLIEQVKSQSLAAGFKHESFTVFEYATPPLVPSYPNRLRLLAFGGVIGLLIGTVLSLIISIFRGVFYTNSAILSGSQAVLGFKSNLIKRTSRLPITKISDKLASRRIDELDQAEIFLSDKKLIYVANTGGRTAVSKVTFMLAAQSSSSGRNVLICDTTGQLNSKADAKIKKKTSDIPIVQLENDIDIVTGYNETYGAAFFTNSTFQENIKKLLISYDQVYICVGRKEVVLGLMALKYFEPTVILLTRLRKTLKSDISKIKKIRPIGILFND